VDGLSDIDSLLIISGTDLERQPPTTVLDRLTQALQSRIGGEATVSHGQLAVTLEYADGMKIQLLPAIRAGDRLRIPSSQQDRWAEVEPQGFHEALTRRNQECGNKLVPTVKLAKGPKTTGAMLPSFFEQAKDLVLTPIRDRTGQSVHVDDYLGHANSESRANASHILARIAKRMRNATAAGSKAQWKALFGFEE